jgi:hypothetical protein
MTTTPSPPAPSAGAPQGQILSKSALSSFILGVLQCLPLGIIAIILAIVGFMKTADPNVKGRWMAVTGGILGVLNIGLWILLVSFGILALLLGLSSSPTAAAHDFIKALADRDTVTLHKLGPGFEEADIKRMEDYMHDAGTFVDTSFSSKAVNNLTAHLEGTVKFTAVEKSVTVDLAENNSKWQVEEIHIK